MIEFLSIVVTVIAVVGVWLNNKKRRECFMLWLVSNGLSMVIHLAAGLIGLAIRDAIFIGLAIQGLYLWRPKS